MDRLPAETLQEIFMYVVPINQINSVLSVTSIHWIFCQCVKFASDGIPLHQTMLFGNVTGLQGKILIFRPEDLYMFVQLETKIQLQRNVHELVAWRSCEAQ